MPETELACKSTCMYMHDVHVCACVCVRVSLFLFASATVYLYIFGVKMGATDWPTVMVRTLTAVQKKFKHMKKNIFSVFKHELYNENKTKKHRETCKQQFITHAHYILFDTWSAVNISGCIGTAITLAKLGHENKDEKNK